MPEYKLPPVDGCFETPPPGFTSFPSYCLEAEDVGIQDMIAGSRTVIVVPYKKGERICSGQWGQFQVLTGLGGQICKGLYVGSTVGRRSQSDPDYNDLPQQKVGVCAEGCDDYVEGDPDVDGGKNGTRCIAVRDRGRWYVTKLGSTAEAVRVAIVKGGNLPVPPYDGAGNPVVPTQALVPSVVAFMPYQDENYTIADVDVDELGEIMTQEIDAGYYTDAVIDTEAANGIKPGIGIAALYAPPGATDNTAPSDVYIINRISGLALMKGQPVVLLSSFGFPQLDDNGEPVLNEDGSQKIITIYEAIG